VDGSRPKDTYQQNKRLKEEPVLHLIPSGGTDMPNMTAPCNGYIGFYRDKYHGKMHQAIGQTPVPESAKQRDAFRTYADAQGCR
jgi:hypothetical protein